MVCKWWKKERKIHRPITAEILIDNANIFAYRIHSAAPLAAFFCPEVPTHGGKGVFHGLSVMSVWKKHGFSWLWYQARGPPSPTSVIDGHLQKPYPVQWTFPFSVLCTEPETEEYKSYWQVDSSFYTQQDRWSRMERALGVCALAWALSLFVSDEGVSVHGKHQGFPTSEKTGWGTGEHSAWIQKNKRPVQREHCVGLRSCFLAGRNESSRAQCKCTTNALGGSPVMRRRLERKQPHDHMAWGGGWVHTAPQKEEYYLDVLQAQFTSQNYFWQETREPFKKRASWCSQ